MPGGVPAADTWEDITSKGEAVQRSGWKHSSEVKNKEVEMDL